ncbi:hypothetical protein DY000_02023881 [Brassica cretica]|nr:hypothetical protein DY000_02023881 [Brassica cretica]
MDTLHLACHEAEAWKLSQITPYTILEDEAREGGQQANIRQGMTGRWRCQVDASWTEQGNGTGFGFTLFDGVSEVVVGQCKARLSNSPLHAEAECLAWTMEELSGRGFKHVRFESDRQQLVQIINSSKAWPALDTKLDDIELL